MQTAIKAEQQWKHRAAVVMWTAEGQDPSTWAIL